MLIVADKTPMTLSVLGKLRILLAKKLNLIPEGNPNGVYHFLWITEFPFFEWNEETKHWDAMHHPFTMPMEECLPYLESDPGAVRAKCYDLVLNGTELLSGSIRITDWQLQEKMFNALGLTKEEIEAKFGFLVEAYKYGAPPHGGSGMGLDRLAMVMDRRGIAPGCGRLPQGAERIRGDVRLSRSRRPCGAGRAWSRDCRKEREGGKGRLNRRGGSRAAGLYGYPSR